MTQAELRRLARLGAEARQQPLQQEMTDSLQNISRPTARAPATQSLHRGRAKGCPGVRGAVEGAVTRRRRPKMSPQARKRIAEAQRRRWAEWRMKQANQPAEQKHARRPQEEVNCERFAMLKTKCVYTPIDRQKDVYGFL